MTTCRECKYCGFGFKVSENQVCPYLYCKKLYDRTIPMPGNIPDWCPLEDQEE